MFALIDCNNFYVSCERVFNPKLNNKPVVVLSNNDGCAISRSNEAKALGIPMSGPAFKYEKIFRKNNVQVFSSNFPLYGDMSSRVMSILSKFSPNIEIYSIDEAFLKFEGFENYDLQFYCEEIKKTVEKWTGIPISIGVAPTKALAKVSNRVAKKFPEQTKGVYLINSDVKRIKALDSFLKTKSGLDLLSGFKRANNILSAEEKKDGVRYELDPDLKFMKEHYEQLLFQSLNKVKIKIKEAMSEENFTDAMSNMAELRGPIDQFFKEVTVNDENQVIRRNRLCLLNSIKEVCCAVAELSRIQESN